ncbi:MAG TPA: hypothetical protein PLQ05_02180 [Acidobacteriota bacterium]|nr:hypothetical protein [Acidobacteriota bacterium]
MKFHARKMKILSAGTPFYALIMVKAGQESEYFRRENDKTSRSIAIFPPSNTFSSEKIAVFSP